MKDTEGEIHKDCNLSVSNHRDRIGCDICKANPEEPTQCFIGFCGDVLWICNKCFKKVTQ